MKLSEKYRRPQWQSSTTDGRCRSGRFGGVEAELVVIVDVKVDTADREEVVA